MQPASACARQVMAATSAVLPQIQWSIVQMVLGSNDGDSDGDSGGNGDGCLSEPLLADEDAAIASLELF